MSLYPRDVSLGILILLKREGGLLVNMYLLVITEIQNKKEHVFGTCELKKNLKNKISVEWIHNFLYFFQEKTVFYIVQDSLQIGYKTST